MKFFLRRLFAQWIRFFRNSFVRAEENDNVDFPRLEGLLRCTIRNKQLFRQALSHRSYIQIAGNEAGTSNERLEFLGDSILNLVVAEYLFRRDSKAEEGELTKARSRLVSKKALSVFGRDLHLSEFLLMSPSAAQVASRGMETIVADAFEAIIGAIYLDSGYGEVKRFTERCLTNAVQRGDLRTDDENFKSRLLEESQACGYGAPRYVTINEEGPDHDRTFTVEVFIGGVSYGVGAGKNKKDAEQAAAARAVQRFSTHQGNEEE